MGEMTLGADELKTILVPLALIVAAAIGAMLHMRHEWRGCVTSWRSRRWTARAEIGRAGSRIGWARAAWGARLARSRAAAPDLEADGDAEGVAAVTAVAGAGERLDPLLREVATRAMAGGELRSALVRLDEALAYLLVFPGRREDPRTLRRYEVLSEGWRAHAAALRVLCRARSLLQQDGQGAALDQLHGEIRPVVGEGAHS